MTCSASKIASLSLFMVVLTAFADSDTRARFGLKQDFPDAGTFFKRSIVTGSIVPLDLPYQSLSSEQKDYVRSQYEALGVTDEPPFPSLGIGPIYKLIAAGQKKLLVTGDLSLAVDVNELGEGTSVSVLRSPDPEMSKFVASILMLQKYKPALCNGSPCKMQFPIRMTFAVAP